MTKEHDKILKMLETVDPSDTAALDEIDARIWCLVNQCEYVMPCPRGQNLFHYKDRGGDRERMSYTGFGKYTRSLDVLHDAQLEGWGLSTQAIHPTERWFCLAHEPDGDDTAYLESPSMPTEALARCHAFVQTLKWRDGDNV